jgi:para-aminobenzoate synthetase component I
MNAFPQLSGTTGGLSPTYGPTAKRLIRSRSTASPHVSYHSGVTDTRQLDWTFDPLEALRRWPVEARVLMLHSGRHHPRWARRSIMASPVGTYRFAAGHGGRHHGQWIGPPVGQIGHELFSRRPFRDVRTLMKLAGQGLWIGYLSYDLGRWVEKLPERAVDDRGWPIIELAYCPGYLVHDSTAGRWSAHGTWRDKLPFDLAALPPRTADFHASEPASIFTRRQHEAAVARAIEYISAGDIFQVNLAQRFTADFEGDYPLAQRSMYQRLADVSPAWYGAYLELDAFNSPPSQGGAGGGSSQRELKTYKQSSQIATSKAPVDDVDATLLQHLPKREGSKTGRVIASTSPELFLDASADGRVVTRPIKGTRPASVSALELLNSAKDTAELNMIVDLLRNDLGRVCSYGSIRVDEPRTIESHPTVHHGVATISGRLHPSKEIIDLLRATLPGGSITGAPKVRAMQIIDELEPVRRGPYCGSIGWLSHDAACFNIAIRTMLLDPLSGKVDFSVGGGIVADSEPAGEYDETIAKAQAMLKTLRTPARV